MGGVRFRHLFGVLAAGKGGEILALVWCVWLDGVIGSKESGG